MALFGHLGKIVGPRYVAPLRLTFHREAEGNNNRPPPLGDGWLFSQERQLPLIDDGYIQRVSTSFVQPAASVVYGFLCTMR